MYKSRAMKVRNTESKSETLGSANETGDLSRLGSGERNSPKGEGPSGRASGRERVNKVSVQNINYRFGAVSRVSRMPQNVGALNGSVVKLFLRQFTIHNPKTAARHNRKETL